MSLNAVRLVAHETKDPFSWPVHIEMMTGLSEEIKQDSNLNRILEVARKEVKEAKEDNNTLLTIIDKQKRSLDQMAQRLKEMEAQILENAMHYEVMLTTKHELLFSNTICSSV